MSGYKWLGVPLPQIVFPGPEPISIDLSEADRNWKPYSQNEVKGLLLLRRFVAGFRLARYATPVSYIRARALDGVVYFTFECSVPPRDSHLSTEPAEPVLVVTKVAVPLYTLGSSNSPGMLADIIRRALVDTCIHEVDEGFYVAGERPYDPHKNEPR